MNFLIHDSFGYIINGLACAVMCVVGLVLGLPVGNYTTPNANDPAPRRYLTTVNVVAGLWFVAWLATLVFYVMRVVFGYYKYDHADPPWYCVAVPFFLSDVNSACLFVSAYAILRGAALDKHASGRVLSVVLISLVVVDLVFWGIGAIGFGNNCRDNTLFMELWSVCVAASAPLFLGIAVMLRYGMRRLCGFAVAYACMQPIAYATAFRSDPYAPMSLHYDASEQGKVDSLFSHKDRSVWNVLITSQPSERSITVSEVFASSRSSAVAQASARTSLTEAIRDSLGDDFLNHITHRRMLFHSVFAALAILKLFLSLVFLDCLRAAPLFRKLSAADGSLLVTGPRPDTPLIVVDSFKVTFACLHALAIAIVVVSTWHLGIGAKVTIVGISYLVSLLTGTKGGQAIFRRMVQSKDD